MPLFFILSGICASDKAWSKTQFYKKTKSLYIPMLLMEVLFLITQPFMVRVGAVQPSQVILNSGFEVVVNLIVGRYDTLSPIWFIRNLYIVQLFWMTWCSFLQRIKRERILYGLHTILLVSMVILGYISTRLNIFNTESLNALFLCSAYYLIGVLCRPLLNATAYTYSTKQNLIAFSAISITLLAASRRVIVDMYWNRYSNYWVAIVCALMGFYVVSYISIRIQSTSWLSYIRKTLKYVGEKSIWIFALHFYGFKLVNQVLVEVYSLDDGLKAAFPVIHYKYAVAYIAIGLSLPLIIEYIVSRTRREIRDVRRRI